MKSFLKLVFGNWKMTALGALIIYFSVLYREAFDDWVVFAFVIFGAALFLGKDSWINRILGVSTKKIKSKLEEDDTEETDDGPSDPRYPNPDS